MCFNVHMFGGHMDVTCEVRRTELENNLGTIFQNGYQAITCLFTCFVINS